MKIRWIGDFFRNLNYNLRSFVWVLKLTWRRQHVQLRGMLWQTLIAMVRRMFFFFTLFNWFPFRYCKPRKKFLFPSEIRFSKFLNEHYNRLQSPPDFRYNNIHINFVTKPPFIWFQNFLVTTFLARFLI